MDTYILVEIHNVTKVISDSVVSGVCSDILYRFSVDNLPLSFPFHIEPKRALYYKTNSNITKDMRMYLTDALNRPLDLNNIPVSLILILKEE